MQVTRQSSPTICPLPFMHTYITANGSAVACCESQEFIMSPTNTSFAQMWNSESYKNLRRALLDGEKPNVCRKCWSNEDLGLLSNRIEMWRDFEAGLFGYPELMVAESGAIPNSPVAIEIKTNNLCNLKCRMCHPESSHRIGEDKEIISKYRKHLPWSEKVLSSQQTVSTLLNEGEDFFRHLSVVQYSGGEPLISDEQVALTEKLLQNQPERIHLRYATNLTQLNYKNRDYPEIWKHFKKVNVKVSIDGLFDVYNYIRVGGHFEKIVDNIKRLQDYQLPNLHLSIGFTTQAYNVYQLPEFLDYFEKIVPRQAITTHLLHSPQMMMIDVFPDDIREKIIRKIKTRRNDLSSIVSVLESKESKPALWEQLNRYTEEMEHKYKVVNGFRFLMTKYLAEY